MENKKTRTVISKSTHKNSKTGTHTEMVIYREKVGKKMTSQTKHEICHK